MSAPTSRSKRRFKKQASTRPPVVPFTADNDGALCYVRQSHFSDESTSSPVQIQVTHRWTSAYDVPVVATVEDLNVSGDLEPHKREGLKVWLSDAPPMPWKTLVVAKLDRLIRNVMDALELLDWLRARGKRLISIAEGIDSSNSMSEFLITLIAAFARMERERMKERFRASKQALKDAGRWAGEGHVYGTKPVELPKGGWVLGLDPYAVKILQSLSTMARSGKSLTEMCAWLTKNKVVTPRDRQLQLGAERRGEDPATVELKGHEWSGTVLRRLLENPDLVEFGIFEPAEQSEISARLEEKARRKTRGSNQPYEFSGIFTCPVCLEPLWHRIAYQKRTRADGSTVEYTYQYWQCPSRKHGPAMRAEEIEPAAVQSFFALFASVPVRERVVLPPTSHANEIAKLQREYGKVMGGVALSTSAEERRSKRAEGDKILADIDALTALPDDPGGVAWVPTGRTWQEELDGLTPEERRVRWLDVGFRFVVQKRDDGAWSAGWLMPEGWRDEMPEVAERIPIGDIADITHSLDWTPADPAFGEARDGDTGSAGC